MTQQIALQANGLAFQVLVEGTGPFIEALERVLRPYQSRS